METPPIRDLFVYQDNNQNFEIHEVIDLSQKQDYNNGYGRFAHKGHYVIVGFLNEVNNLKGMNEISQVIADNFLKKGYGLVLDLILPTRSNRIHITLDKNGNVHWQNLVIQTENSRQLASV